MYEKECNSEGEFGEQTNPWNVCVQAQKQRNMCEYERNLKMNV